MKPLSQLYKEKLSLIEMPADENFRFTKDTKAIDEAVIRLIDAVDRMQDFDSYPEDIEDAGAEIDIREAALDEALNELRQVLEGSKVEL